MLKKFARFVLASLRGSRSGTAGSPSRLRTQPWRSFEHAGGILALTVSFLVQYQSRRIFFLHATR